MPQGTDQQADARAAAASLAAEAALLEGRLRMLREAIAAVDVRIESVSESLRQLRTGASGTDDAALPTPAAENAEGGGSSGDESRPRSPGRDGRGAGRSERPHQAVQVAGAGRRTESGHQTTV
jgi:hypothetical protein